jgi:tRNA G18 (ribose-2'-O)-methylase SpoU
MEFNIVLHNLKSPQNVGMIVRSAVAFGCNRIFIIGKEPWHFKKSTQAFSRRLEKKAKIDYYKDEDDIFNLCKKDDIVPIAIEIAENESQLMTEFRFPPKIALFVGNESYGLQPSTLLKCGYILTIPQYGPVGSLNVAISSSIAMYEFMRNCRKLQQIKGSKYDDAESN